MADVMVQFSDGSSHTYQGVPDGVTPDQVEARAVKDFGKKVVSLGKGGAPAPAANAAPPAAAAAPAQPAAPGMGTGILESAAHGATFGLADNVGGVLDAILAPSSRGFVTDMRENIAARKDQRAAFANEHPVIAGAADLAGGVAGTALTAGAGGGLLALKAGKPVANLGRMAVNALPYGVVQGAADAGEGDGLRGAATGGITAAIAAPAFGALAQLGGWAGRKGGTMLTDYMANGANRNRAAVNPLLDAMDNSGMTPQQLRATIQAAPEGAQESIATAAARGGSVQQLGKRAVLAAGPGKDVGRQAINDSVSGMLPTVRGMVSDMAGMPAQDAGRIADAIKAAREARAPSAYGAIPNTPLEGAPVTVTRPGADVPTIDDELNFSLRPTEVTEKTDAFTQMLEDNPAYARAHNDAVSSNNSVSPSGGKMQPLFGPSGKLVRKPTWEDVDAIKKGLDARIRNAKGIPIANDAPSADQLALKKLAGANDTLMSATDAIAPEYAAVRKQWGDSAELEDAIRTGEDTSMKGEGASPDEIDKTLKGLSDTARQGYRVGATSGLNNRLITAVNTAKHANLPAEMIGHGLEAGGKKELALRATYGNADTGGNVERVGNFLNQMAVLRKRFDVKDLVSRDGSFENSANDGAGYFTAAGHGGLVRAGWHALNNAAKAIAGKVTDEGNRAIASEVFTPRAGDQSDAFMKMLDQAYAARLRTQGRMPALSRATTATALQALRLTGQQQ